MKQRQFFIYLFSLLVCCLSSHAATIAHWRFEEGTSGATASGTGSIIDETGLHNGTPFGGPIYSTNVPNPENTLSLQLDGSNDHVNGGNSVITDGIDFTVEGWFFMTSSGSRGGVFQRREGGVFNGFHFGKGNSTQWSWSITDSSGNRIIVLAPEVLNEWAHWAGTFNSATKTVELFLNGVSVGANTNTNFTGNTDISSQNNLLIGRRDTAHFQGFVGEVKISDTALTTEEFLINTPFSDPVPEPSSYLLLLVALAFSTRVKVQK